MAEELAGSRQGGNTDPLANKTKHVTSFQTKNFAFTLFADEEPLFDEADMQYLAFGKETTKEGRHHWQGFVIFHRKKSSLSRIAPMFHPTKKAHVEPMLGTFLQNEKYCSKQGTYKEFGTKPAQGARTDLTRLVNAIMEGETTTDDIVANDPIAFHSFGRTLERAEQIRMGRQYRTEMTQGLWIHGPTERGKSHYAYKCSGYPMEEIHTQQGHDSWWDHYRQQPCVVLNEFRGQMPYSALLQLVDKWPYTVDRRYRGPIPFTSKLVIVTSPMTPEEVYRGVLSRNDSIAQLLRRFRVVHIDDLRREVDGEM